MLQLSGLLQNSASEASEFHAKKSRESAARMETMTVKMQDLAVKTRQETVSMRVITIVTLFFLPATFIAVSDRCRTLNAHTDCIYSDFHEYRHSQIRTWRTRPADARSQVISDDCSSRDSPDFCRMVLHILLRQKGRSVNRSVQGSWGGLISVASVYRSSGTMTIHRCLLSCTLGI